MLYAIFSLHSWAASSPLVVLAPGALEGLNYDQAVKRVEPLLKSIQFTWPSAATIDGVPLSSAPVKSFARAATVAKFAAVSNVIELELRPFLPADPEERTAKVWDLYAKAYDRAVLYCTGYREMVATVSFYAGQLAAELKRPLQVLDAGSGTGNFPYLLSWEHPDWFFTLTDFSKGSLALAGKKMLSVQNPSSEKRNFLRLYQNLNDTHVGEAEVGTQDVIILNNVLYNFPSDKKKSILTALVKRLRAEGLLFLGEPLAEFQSIPTKKLELFLGVAKSAVEHGSPFTEFDGALLIAINRLLVTSSPSFMTFEAQGALGSSVGLKAIAGGVRYYNSIGFWVFQKPR